MNAHNALVAAMRKALKVSGLAEAIASGEFTLPATKPTLFPGAVYGFAVRMSASELAALFDEAQSRSLSRIAKLKDIQPIGGTLYPLYWGKDKQLGARPYQHLNNPRKTGAVRLSTYAALRGKSIACATMIVSDYVEAERIIQVAYPHILKTSTVQHGA